MLLLKTACLALLPFIALCSLTKRSAAQPPKSSWVGPSQVDTPIKVIHVRRVARVLFGFGKPADDDSLLKFGPARARVLWQKGWRWNESVADKIPLGLQGGPGLSFDVLFDNLGPLYSLETRVSSLRYSYARMRRHSRPLSEELSDPKEARQSVEAGLYLNFALGDLLSPFRPHR